MVEPIEETRAPPLSEEDKMEQQSSSSSQPDIDSIVHDRQLCEDEPEEYPPIQQAALTMPTTDDPSITVLTFRTWVLGTVSCVLLSFLNQFFWYRTEPLTITAISA